MISLCYVFPKTDYHKPTRKQRIQKYVVDMADSKPKEEVLQSFALLLFRMAAAEEQLQRSAEATASAREHAMLLEGSVSV